ncbi:MAG TPA: hypothetical protein VGO91_04975 [Pyrinomonadaceae bacterium]|jgi:hypothetical protein|nr:hypothetical protein [Pyrinomonadaceae bacterium]
MYDQTLIPVGHSAVVANANGAQRLNEEYIARLNWLLHANAQAAAHRKLFRNDREEDEALMMRRPLQMRQAYALFGLMLGTLPPAAIFGRMFQYGLGKDGTLVCLCLLMNIICAVVGYAMGSALSGNMHKLTRASWNKMLLISPWVGALWGMVAGGAGGFLFFGFGAIAGIICGIPVGMAAFLLFALLHRLLARGGMIDARHFWPLACGITLTMAALVLSL